MLKIAPVHPAPFFLVLLIPGALLAQDLQPGANFANTPAKVPQTTSYSNSAHLFDADNDGDLDAFATQGGSFFSLQSRLWLSNASTAGGSFIFSDATSGSLPVLLSRAQHVQSRDLDKDGDLDLLLVNSTQVLSQSNIWLINQGGLQGGTTGVFSIDQSRFVSLGAAGSSIHSSLLLTSGTFAGGFADWSTNCSFADVDLDGDCDYLQNGPGPNFSGATMSRLFLNNGSGFFTEYNPSGVVSGAAALAGGSSAGWCEGTQADNTTNTTGANHDITNISFKSDFADIDQDLDLDLVIQSRGSQSRIYQNRFIENGLSVGNEIGGTRIYRDITTSALTLLQTGGSCMELQFGDLDSDDDVDIWGASYANLQERILLNDGTGVFTNGGSPLGDPGTDENEIGFVDYDSDGDLDAVAASFDGINYLYKNETAQGAATSAANTFLKRTSVLGTETELASPGTVANSWLSIETGDLDNDKDTDLFFTHDEASTSAAVHINTLGAADLIAPRIPIVQILGSVSGPSPSPRRVAAQVYENADTSQLRDAVGTLKFTVNGGPAISKLATWCGGNLFRSEIPGYWVGQLQYWMEVTDRAGNTGTSQVQNVVIPSAGISNYGFSTPGCSGAQSIFVNSAPSVQNPEFVVHASNCPPQTLNLMLVSDGQDLVGTDLQLGVIFFVDTTSPEFVGFDAPSDITGLASVPVSLVPLAPLVGNTYYAQIVSYWGSGPCSPTTTNLTSTDAISITLLP
ncbi:MAG: FG-GAP repeat domain-containing protein [Planctomycetota bacterium]